MPRSGLVPMEYIENNFRPATVEDFHVGLGYAEVKAENDGGLYYAIRGKIVTRDLLREAASFHEGINNGTIWVITYYTGGPIGGAIE